MSVPLVGRTQEWQILESLYRSDEAEFVAVYGRIRVGKTYLIREFFAQQNCYYFELVGQRKASMAQQLAHFANSFEKTFTDGLKIKPPDSWQEAFQMLTRAMTKLQDSKRIVIFLDELPWLDTRRSNLIPALDHIWNSEWVKNPNIFLVVCGSAASWMIRKIINDRGGLHNRVTKILSLSPFKIAEVERLLKSRGINLPRSQVLQIYMATGGIPFYLRLVEKGKSATQNINDLCFKKNGQLHDEFDRLFESLFDNAQVYKELIKIIANKRCGIEQNNIVQATSNLKSGGAFKDKLNARRQVLFSQLPRMGVKRKVRIIESSMSIAYFT